MQMDTNLNHQHKQPLHLIRNKFSWQDLFLYIKLVM